MNEQINVPKLRFSEFEGKWISSKLGDLSAIRSASRVHREQWTDAGVPFFRSSDVVAAYKGSDNNKAFISYELFEELSEKSGKPKKGDLLVTGGGSIGIPYLIPNDEPLYFKDADLLWFKNNKALDGHFLYDFLTTSKFRRYLASITHTGTISHYTIEQAKSTPITLPELPEQQKIASFLSKVDEKIALLTEKKAKLTEYKKGVMQQLFNGKWEEQEGLLTFIPPTLRFKADDGSEFPDWEEKALGDFTKPVKRKASKAISKVMTISASQGFLDQKERFSQVIAGSSLDRYTHIKKGEFSYNRGNSKTFKYGCIYLMREDEALVPFVYRTFKLTSGIPEFYQQLFLNHVLDRQLRKMISSSARMDGLLNIGEKDFYKVKLLFPSLKEQTKIANFLSSLDQKIDIANSELNKAKEWKKGLLQQMFV